MRRDDETPGDPKESEGIENEGRESKSQLVMLRPGDPGYAEAAAQLESRDPLVGWLGEQVAAGNVGPKGQFFLGPKPAAPQRRRVKAQLAEHAESITHTLMLMENAVADAPEGEMMNADRRALRRELERLSTLADALLSRVSELGDPTN